MLVPSGFKLNISPATMFYLPVNRSVINQISFHITDEEENLLDFRGEEMALAVHLKQI